MEEEQQWNGLPFQGRWGATLAPTSPRHAEADALRSYACSTATKGHITLALIRRALRASQSEGKRQAGVCLSLCGCVSISSIGEWSLTAKQHPIVVYGASAPASTPTASLASQ
ncbi:MAG TPA: hypothetical protein VH593_14910 [Ktedonobacteraceae bacterium]